MKKFLIAAFASLNLFNSYSQEAQKFKNIEYRSNMSFGSSNSDLSNIGGYVDGSGNEYALVGWQQGLRIVDVSDPSTPLTIKEVPGNNSIWREVKTKGNFAYVTTEGGGGLQIIDLSSLPNANDIQVKLWTPAYDGANLNTIHALHIDGDFLYLYGSNIGNKGALICDISDPWNPTILGNYDNWYVHDGYVLNDTLYSCHIYDGFFTVVNMADKANPVILAQQNTPSNFSHNSWLSDDHKTLFTTDEVNDSYLASYDISDLNNIQELDRIQSQNPGSQSIVHNVHILNDFAVTSYYKDGITITDVHRPQNMVITGWYDTSPLSGGEFDGAWGVYPFLPSGNLVVSDISEGLFVLKPTYKRACYLEGQITDSVCGGPLSGVTITAYGADTITVVTDNNGEFKTGTPDTGVYRIEISKPGYPVKFFYETLSPGVVTLINSGLGSSQAFNLTGLVNNQQSGPVANAMVSIGNNNVSYTFVSNSNGEFSKCGVIPDNYTVAVGNWGYHMICNTENLSTGNNPLTETLQKGYSDDFTFNLGWTVVSSASTGAWEIGVPKGTTISNNVNGNPGSDSNNDCTNKAYVTGNSGSSAGDDDVDNGNTRITSPVMDLTAFADPVLNYERWFANGGGNSAGNDSMIIYLTDGVQTKVIEKITRNTAGMGTWVAKSVRVKDYFVPTTSMKVIVHIEDYAPGHVLEGGFDNFEITENPTAAETITAANNLKVYPVPFSNSLTIENSGEESVFLLEISDLAGKVVYKANQLPIGSLISIEPDLNSGVYFLTLRGHERTILFRIIKN